MSADDLSSFGGHSPLDEHYTKISEYFDRPDWWEDGRQAIEDFFSDGNTSLPAQHQDLRLNKLLDTFEDGVQGDGTKQVETLDDTNIDIALRSETNVHIPAQDPHLTNGVDSPEESVQIPSSDAHLVQKDSAIETSQYDITFDPLPNNDTHSPYDEREDVENNLTNEDSSELFNEAGIGESAGFILADNALLTSHDFDDATPPQSPIHEPTNATVGPSLSAHESSWLQGSVNLTQSPNITSFFLEHDELDDAGDAVPDSSMALAGDSMATTLSPSVQDQSPRGPPTQITDFAASPSFPPNPYSLDPLPSTYQDLENPSSASDTGQQSGHLQESTPASPAQEGQDRSIHERINEDKEIAVSPSDQNTNESVQAVEPKEAEVHINLEPGEQQNYALTDRVTYGRREIRHPMVEDPSLLPFLHATWHQTYGEPLQETEQDTVGGAEEIITNRDQSNEELPKNGPLFREVFPATLATRKRKAFKEHPEEPPYKRMRPGWGSYVNAVDGDDIRISTDAVAEQTQPSIERVTSQVIADRADGPRFVLRHSSSSSSLSSLSSLGNDFNNTNPDEILQGKPVDLDEFENKRKVEPNDSGDTTGENTELVPPTSPREHIQKKAKLSLRHATRPQRLPDPESQDELSTPSKPLSLRPSRIPKPLSLAKHKTATPLKPRTKEPAISTASKTAPKRTGVSTRELDSMFNTSSWQGKGKNTPDLSSRLRSATPRSESVAPRTRSTRSHLNIAARDVEADAHPAAEQKAEGSVPRYSIGSNELKGLGLDTPPLSPKPRRQGAVKRSAPAVTKPLSLAKSKSLSLANSGGQKTARNITKTSTMKPTVKGKEIAKPSTRHNDKNIKEEEAAAAEDQAENLGEAAEAPDTTTQPSELTEIEPPSQVVPEASSSSNTRPSGKTRATASEVPTPNKSTESKLVASKKAAAKPPTPKEAATTKPSTPKEAATTKPPTPKEAATTKPPTPKKAAVSKLPTPGKATSGGGSTPKKSKDIKTNTELKYPKIQNKELAALKDWTVKDVGDGEAGGGTGGEGSSGVGKRSRREPDRFRL